MSAQSVAILSSELFQTLIMLTGVVIVVASVVGIVCYIFQSISLYRIAKRRNIPAPGLAWVPIANIYLIGKIGMVIWGIHCLLRIGYQVMVIQ